MDPAVQLTVYRVVQEAVSNAVRHAAGAVVEVGVRQVGGGLIVRVLNGPGVAGDRAGGGAGSGHGVVGMRERVALLDGRFRAAATADGGYLVEAVLPLSGVAGTAAVPPGEGASDATLSLGEGSPDAALSLGEGARSVGGVVPGVGRVDGEVGG